MNANKILRYSKSKFVQQVICEEDVVIWHSLFGNPRVITKDALIFLNMFEGGCIVDDIYNLDATKEDIEAILDDFLNCYFLIEDNFDERAFLGSINTDRTSEITNGSLITYLGLIMSEACNFKCKYCIHFNNLDQSDRDVRDGKLMSIDTAKKSIETYIDILISNNKNVAEINFGGGEPLLNWPVVKWSVLFCEDNYGEIINFDFSINTNASLITKEIAEFLKNHNIKIASSLDGIGDVNDSVRLTNCGKGTFTKIIEGFSQLEEVNYPIDGFAVTINGDNFPGIDNTVIDWAHERGMTNVRIDIDVIDSVDIPIDDVVKKFLEIRRYANDKGIDVPGFWLRPVENLNHSIVDTKVGFCGGAKGASMCVNPLGNLYYCGYSSRSLGNILDEEKFYGKDSIYERSILEYQIGSIEMCKGCIIEGQCGGGCRITQEFSEVACTLKLERMCEFYKKMTLALLRELSIS